MHFMQIIHTIMTTELYIIVAMKYNSNNIVIIRSIHYTDIQYNYTQCIDTIYNGIIMHFMQIIHTS